MDYAGTAGHTLARDQFFGRRLGAAAIGQFSLSLTRYERHAAIPWHAHGDSYATVVVSGGYAEAYRDEIASGVRECRAGDVVVHAGGERHADTFVHGHATCLNIHGSAFERSTLLSRPDISVLARKAFDEFRHPDALSPLALEALMLELFVAAARHSEADRVPAWLVEVRRTLRLRFQEPLTLAELAGAAGVHAGHVARAFRQHYGTTVGGALRDLRVDYAKQRLATAAPLQEIALDAGFADQSHLTRTFRRTTGVTPAAFRRALRSSRSRM
jgi:AraC family transcriptional regulator